MIYCTRIARRYRYMFGPVAACNGSCALETRLGIRMCMTFESIIHSGYVGNSHKRARIGYEHDGVALHNGQRDRESVLHL